MSLKKVTCFAVALICFSVFAAGCAGESGPAPSEAPRPSASPERTKEPEATAAPSPTPTPYTELREGAQGEMVRKLQEALMELGYLAQDKATDYYGSLTRDVYKRQEHVGAKMVIPMHYGSAGAKAAHALRTSRILAPFRGRMIMPLTRGQTVLFEKKEQ